MLEVKDLHKSYRTKKGAVTKALDGVSLNFPETGMVFILGKSGSGKSTLLNVCGGLDRYDSGEIIIKGKSSKDFSGQDFDSYRNTYVGFVFQEYNILDEFTVEENIALALELQNKKRDAEVIAKILADVDMTEFAKRKPNTLSGGQKQRVAIARALVKEPEIIMADEPTGALDSKTGKQVFDTLKKLSEQKLVLVVSHDRDFAEQYGDRIIELKDGKVIFDQVRAQEGEGAKNVRFFGTDTVCVQDGSKVTDADLDNIKKFLNRAGGSAVISTSRERINALKEDAPEMSVGAFENIKEQPASKEYPQQKLIRSHLPVRHAVRMGASSLKTKPVRLVFTIILSVVAFILFGLASTLMLFDEKKVTVETLMTSDYDTIVLQKAYWQTEKSYQGDKLEDTYTSKQQTNYTYEEYEAFLAKYPGAIAAISGSARFDNVRLEYALTQFYSESCDGFILANDTLTMLAGRLPTAKDEVAISDFMFDAFKSDKASFTYYVDGDDGEEEKKLSLENGGYSEILYTSEKPITLNFNSARFKIVGVYKGMTVPDTYSELKQAADQGKSYTGDGMTQYEWQQNRRSGMYARLAVNKDFVNEYASSGNDNGFDSNRYFRYSSEWAQIGVLDLRGDSEYLNGTDTYMMAKYEEDTGYSLLKLYDLDGNAVTSLGANAVAMSASYLGSVYRSAFNTFRDVYDPDFNQDEFQRLQAVYNLAYEEYVETHPEPNSSDFGSYDEYDVAWEAWNNAKYEYAETAELNANRLKAFIVYRNTVQERANVEFLAANPMPDQGTQWEEYVQWNNERNQYVNEVWNEENVFWSDFDGLNKEQTLARLKTMRTILQDMGALDIKIKNNFESAQPVTISAVFMESTSAVYLGSSLYDTFYVAGSSSNWHTEYETKYEQPEDAQVYAIYIPYDKSKSLTEELVGYTYEHNDDDSTAEIANPVMSQLSVLITLADTLKTVFLIAGLILALFAFLLMFNFISASITAKKKEIGILRAIGARTLDTFKIFISEALIIAAICFAISAIGAFGLCIVLNNVLIADTFIKVTIFVFGPVSVLCILAIAIVTAMVSTIIPVGLYSRKPPISSIRAL
ncbi:MAG: ABC transporter ATP-binding protein/permease [Roseburia sp.]|nr:ABC transporter ATP-binding protein/permease [Roseburia sp.]